MEVLLFQSDIQAAHWFCFCKIVKNWMLKDTMNLKLF